jgi:hypothetical protein
MQLHERVIKWNAARYDQVYDYNLARDLLTEEINELFDAQTNVDIMDACGDIVFVAIGVFWKLGIDTSNIHNILYYENLSTINDTTRMDWCNNIKAAGFDIINRDIPHAYSGYTYAVDAIFMIVLPMLKSKGMQSVFYDILKIICDSNDTKVVKGKTDPTVKANIVKGLEYKPPTQDLLVLYSKVKGVMQ